MGEFLIGLLVGTIGTAGLLSMRGVRSDCAADVERAMQEDADYFEQSGHELGNGRTMATMDRWGRIVPESRNRW